MAQKILIIDGHPDPERGRLCHTLAEAYVEGAMAAGKQIRLITLAETPVEILRTALSLARIERWAQITKSGDFAEIDGLDERSPIIPIVSSSRENCLGQECPDWKACHVVKARREASEVASEIAEAVPAKAEATVGDSDPVLAAKDALREFPADEVVVVTRPDEDATWLEAGSGKEIERELGDIPVRRITVQDA